MNKLLVPWPLRNLLKGVAILLTVITLLLTGMAILFLHYTPSCTHVYNRAVVTLPGTDWDIITVDDSCEVVTRIVAENKLTHEKKDLVGFLTMEDANVMIEGKNIVIEVDNPENITTHQDSLVAYRIVLGASRAQR